MKKLIITLTLLGCLTVITLANPVIVNEIKYIKASPPEIGIYFYEPESLGGQFIYTTSGMAVIGDHPFPDLGQLLIFDSSNTSGFVLNPEADSISVTSTVLIEPVGYGTMGMVPAPIEGHHLRKVQENYNRWSYDFTTTDYGATEIVINEINAHCDWGPEANFIELYNRSESAIDISGWMLICDTVWLVPENTVIGGKGFYVFDQYRFPETFDMDAGADNIYLVNSDLVIVDQVGWSSDHGANVSFMRFPDGDVNLVSGYYGYNDHSSYTFENGFPSRGAPNRHYSPGFVVIGTQAAATGQDVDISWTNPIWDSNFDYSVVVRNLDHFPANPSDGYTVYQGTGQEALDTGLPNNSVIHYTAFARNINGGYSIPTDESRVFVIIGSAGIDGESNLPERISSLECYPNPFNASVTIDFVLRQSGSVTLSIYNLRGQRVEILANDSRSAGEHRITWDGSDFPSGVYFARLQIANISKSVKMVLLK